MQEVYMLHSHAPLIHCILKTNTPLNTCTTRVRGECKKVYMLDHHAPLKHLEIIVAHTLINLNIPLNTCKTNVRG